MEFWILNSVCTQQYRTMVWILHATCQKNKTTTRRCGCITDMKDHRSEQDGAERLRMLAATRLLTHRSGIPIYPCTALQLMFISNSRLLH